MSAEMKIEFVSYTGEYPNLCSGTLTLLIDGEEIKFGYNGGDYPRFWFSGGECDCWNDYVGTGEWTYNDSLPDIFNGYEQKLIDIFNANVPYGCCGGCI